MAAGRWSLLSNPSTIPTPRKLVFPNTATSSNAPVTWCDHENTFESTTIAPAHAAMDAHATPIGTNKAASIATRDMDEIINAGNAQVNTYFSAIEIVVAGIGRTMEIHQPTKKAAITMPITPRNYFPTTVPQGIESPCDVKQ
jgi:hypothetical protein